MCWHTGLPLDVGPESELTLARLQAAGRSGARFASVHVHLSAQEQWPPPPETPNQIVSALAGSAGTLTELHGLPLMEGQDRPEMGLAAFKQLRSLGLLQTWDGPGVLHVELLPATLEELELRAAAEEPSLPWFSDLDSLNSLRQLTFVNYIGYEMGSADSEQGQGCPLRVPPSFQVRNHPFVVAAQSRSPQHIDQSPRSA